MSIFGIEIPVSVVGIIRGLALVGRGYTVERDLGEQISDFFEPVGEQKDVLHRISKNCPPDRLYRHIRIVDGAVAAAAGNPPPPYRATAQAVAVMQRAGCIAYMAMQQALFDNYAKHGSGNAVSIHGWKSAAKAFEADEKSDARKCADCDEGQVLASEDSDICRDCIRMEAQSEVCCDRCSLLGLGETHAPVLRDFGTSEKYLCSPCADGFPHYPYCPICAGADEPPPEHSWEDPVTDWPSGVSASLFQDAQC